jgi:hypothetical protein
MTSAAQEKTGYAYQAKPRINYGLLKSNRGRTVTIVGTLDVIGDNFIVIKTTDNENLKVRSLFQFKTLKD